MLIGIHRLRNLHIITGTIIHPFAGVRLAGFAAAAAHFFAAFVALCKMLIAFRISAIDHFVGGFAAVIAGGDHYRVHAVYIDRKAIVKNITFAFKIFSACFFAIFNDLLHA